MSAETDTFNPLSFWTPQIYADVAPVSADINTFSARNILELSVAQRFAVSAQVSSDANAAFLAANPEVRYIGQVGVTIGSDAKDCYADCYDDY